MGILGDEKKLSAVMDVSCYNSGANHYGVKVCDCRSNGIYDCKCSRRYSDPDARWGWDSFTKTGNFMTIHRAKGREFENVLVNIKQSRDEARVLTVNDVLCNPVIFSDNCDNDSKYIGEYTRLVYVGASRAINNLYLYVDANDIDTNTFEQALQEFMTNNSIAETFYKFLTI